MESLLRFFCGGTTIKCNHVTMQKSDVVAWFQTSIYRIYGEREDRWLDPTNKHFF